MQQQYPKLNTTLYNTDTLVNRPQETAKLNTTPQKKQTTLYQKNEALHWHCEKKVNKKLDFTTRVPAIEGELIMQPPSTGHSVTTEPLN